MEGATRMRIGGVERDLAVGEEVVVPAGVPHKWWNAGEQPTRVRVEFRPGLRMREFFETLFAWVNQGKARGGIITNPLRAAVLATTYRDEIQFPRQRAIPLTLLPRPVLSVVLTCLAAIGRRLGYRAVP